MPRYVLLAIGIFFIGQIPLQAQYSYYVIRLKNKTGTPYSINDPSRFLTQRAIERRIRYNIPIDETDLPVTPRYIDSIRLSGNVTVLNASKWLNQVCVYTTDDAALSRINAFDFVESSVAVAARAGMANRTVSKDPDTVAPFNIATPLTTRNTDNAYSYGAAYSQIHLHNAEFLHNRGFGGQGMQMALIDAGFYHYLSLPTFDSARNNNQILDTWDFVANDTSVNEDDSHGMKCFSTIAANMPGIFTGAAPAASYCLYRTEDVSSEYPVEEQNWVAAAERADSLGVDVITTSLGYFIFNNSSFNHTYAEMNGNTTIAASAVNAAAKKGILVAVAIGNDGNNSIHYLSTPADADSALTIGAVDVNRQAATFSSYGPDSDGQIKPDVAAIGVSTTVAEGNTGQPVAGNGTSFATPVMAGIAACLWQAFPEIKNMDILQGLRQSGDRFTNPDDRTGYGIPDVKKAFVNFIKQLHAHSASVDSCNAVFNFSIKAAEGMNVIIERMLPSDNDYAAIAAFNFSGNFFNRNFTYTDSLGSYTGGVNIKYRFKMNIGTDTSFYIDSVSPAYNNQCAIITERKICPGTATYFSVNAANGYSYQWQVNAGSGFADVNNNSFYSGANSNVLILKNLPQNFYGYQYRCMQINGSDTIYSTPVTLKFTSTWTGAVSTAWKDSNNWSCGVVPDEYIDAVIGTGIPNYPIVDFNAACHSLLAMPGASVLVKNGARLIITGQ